MVVGMMRGTYPLNLYPQKEWRIFSPCITQYITCSKQLITDLSDLIFSSLYVCHFSAMVDFSSEKYSGSTGHRNSWYQQRNLE